MSLNRKRKYNKLLQDLLIEEDNIANLMDRSSRAIEDVQTLFDESGLEEKAKHPGEGYLDSRVLKATSEIALRCSEGISGNLNIYDKHELAQHIRENPAFWEEELMFPFEVPTFAYLFGTFAAIPSERRVVRRVERQKAVASQLMAPASVDSLERTETGSEMVNSVYRHIKKLYKVKGGQLSYFHVVLDPHSYSNTVENIYHISFLVRDGAVAIHIDKDSKLPFLTPVQKQGHGQGDDGDEDHQFIVSLDMKRWKELVNAFRITKPLIMLKR